MTEAKKKRINTDELHAELLQLKGKFSGWAASKAGAASALKTQHAKSVEDYRGHLSALQAEQQLLSQNAVEAQAQFARQREEAEALHAEVSKSEQQKFDSEGKAQALREAVDSMARKLGASKKDLRAEKAAVNLELQKVEDVNSQFKNWLGLRFVQSQEIPGELLIIFDHISVLDMHREYLLGVQVQPGDAYKVTTCKPMLAEISQLQDELNASHDFSSFVRKVRKQFQRLRVSTES